VHNDERDSCDDGDGGGGGNDNVRLGFTHQLRRKKEGTMDKPATGTSSPRAPSASASAAAAAALEEEL
jgi:hypothetical protein